MFLDSDTERDVGSMLSSVKDKFKESFAFDAEAIKNAGKECHLSAKETTSICNTTSTKAEELVAYGSQMKSALGVFQDGLNLQDISSIHEIISNDKLQNALSLANEIDDLAISCARQSIKMIDAIDSGIESLPDVLEKNVNNRMELAQQKGSKESDRTIPDIEKDVRELEIASDDVFNVNPFNAIETYQKAFDEISSKGNMCKELFQTILDFAEDVANVSSAIENFTLGKLIGHIGDLVKDIWRCLRLSDLIRSFSKAAETIIKCIVKVIKAMATKVQGFDMSFLTNCGCGDQITSTLSSFGFSTADLKKAGIDLSSLLGSKDSQAY